MIKSRPRDHIVVTLVAILLGVTMLAGCELPTPRQTDESQIRFDFSLPEGWQVINADYAGQVQRADTDGDNEEEWIIHYSFDQPGSEAFAPVGVVIYDIAHREPKLPIIYPYHLRAPGWGYLGEQASGVSVEVSDVVSHIRIDETNIYSATNEVVVRSTDAGGGRRRVSIFQWRYRRQPELAGRVDPHEVLVVPGQPLASGEWYECIGRFEGTLDVVVKQNEVVVRDQIEDRSQLARLFVYHPSGQAGGYLDRNQELVSPAAVCLSLASGVPTQVSRSPYPEKVVMAFLSGYRQEPDDGHDLLSDQAASRWRNDPALAAVSGGGTIDSGLCVKLVSYNPQSVVESEIESFALAEQQEITDYQVRAQPEIKTQATLVATPTVVPIRARIVTSIAVAGQKDPITIEWRLIQQANRWQIDDIIPGSNP